MELSGTGTLEAGKQVLSSLLTQTDGAGSAGDLTIETGRLIVRDGAQVSASTLGAGQGGTLAVTASDFVELSGTSANGDRSSLFVATEGIGSAGDLTIETGKLLVQQGAQVSASTSGIGQAGNLSVTAPESMTLSGAGSLSAQATSGGNAGDLTINTLALTVQDGAEVTVSSPQGRAGNLTATADSILLDQGKLTAITGAGSGGNIGLSSQDLLLMRDNSLISAEALNTANGAPVAYGGKPACNAGLAISISTPNSSSPPRRIAISLLMPS